MTGERDTILVVDDVAENIDLLSGILKDSYKVKAATSGERALKLACSDPPPDLILLDIMMPEINGYMVLQKLKKMEATKDIPVIFVTAMGETVDETKGLLMGAVDYIIKPVQPSIVKARVKTHLKLRQSQNHIKSLYDETLTGIISLLTDLLTAANPVAYSRSSHVRLHMGKVLKKLDLQRYWEFDLAAMLSKIGCVTLDASTLERIYSGKDISGEEYGAYKEHPRIGRRLLQNIPHLTLVGKIIRKQDRTLEELLNNPDRRFFLPGASRNPDPVILGAGLLKIAVTVEKYVQRGNSQEESFRLVALQLRKINPELAELLDAIASEGTTLAAVEIKDLLPGMILEKDLYTRNKALLLCGGTPLTPPILERIKAFQETVGLVGPVLVSFFQKETHKKTNARD